MPFGASDIEGFIELILEARDSMLIYTQNLEFYQLSLTLLLN